MKRIIKSIIKPENNNKNILDWLENKFNYRNRQEWENVIATWYADDLPGVHPDARRMIGNNLQKACLEPAT